METERYARGVFPKWPDALAFLEELDNPLATITGVCVGNPQCETWAVTVPDERRQMGQSEQGLLIVCENSHEQRLKLRGYDFEEAKRLAGIMDGTSPVYKFPPREHPIEGSKIAKCDQCGAWFTATPYGFPETT